ncbi:MAG: hypothetical protein KDA61_23305, partial [Planctomycetales bacterium]|nr:hypothetical protein [Planctomycetales bacterium]
YVGYRNGAAPILPGETAPQGNLFVRSGGTAESLARWTIGHFADAVGLVEVDGPNSSVTVGSDLEVGRDGHGTLALQNDATISVGNQLFVGVLPGGTGAVTMTGGVLTTGASATASDADIEVGYAGVGVFTQSGGTTTVAQDLILGQTSTGHGTLNLQGGVVQVLSQGTEDNGLYVGLAGTGVLNVTGGALDVAGALRAGDRVGGDGAITVNGVAASIAAHDLYLGGDRSVAGGTGSLTLTEGEVQIAADVKLWSSGSLNIAGGWFEASSFEQGSGTLSHTGGTLFINGGTFDNGGGELNISSSKSLGMVLYGGATAHPDDVNLGVNADEGGVLVLSRAGGGSPSKLTAEGDIKIGDYGVGRLNVEASSQVSVIDGKRIYAGYGEGSYGIFNVYASDINAGDELVVGYAGTGRAGVYNGTSVTTTRLSMGAIATNTSAPQDMLTIQNGATVTITQDVVMANGSNRNTALSLSQASDLLVGGNLYLGNKGSAALTITNGALVDIGNVAEV